MNEGLTKTRDTLTDQLERVALYAHNAINNRVNLDDEAAKEIHGQVVEGQNGLNWDLV